MVVGIFVFAVMGIVFHCLQEDNPWSMFSSLAAAYHSFNTRIERYIPAKWVLGIESLALFGIGIGMVDLEQYAVAVAAWIVLSIILVAKAFDWDGIEGAVGLTKFLRAFWIIGAVVLGVYLTTATDLKRGGQPWSNLQKWHNERPLLIVRVADYPGHYSSGSRVGGIEWKEEYDDTRLFITNNDSVEYSPLDLKLNTNQTILKVAQVTGFFGISAQPDFPLDITSQGKTPDGHEQSIPWDPSDPRFAGTNNWKVHCERIPRLSTVELVLVVSGRQSPRTIDIKGSFESDGIVHEIDYSYLAGVKHP